ncbi:hypothetical protein BLNAU_8169 [Blattamonas nauphoetae]|uniref:Uncharacterized protein n=1 Tax=Blattamonas nauphoetae TaxID=2049346 RepID=A0ABQ9XZJ7_9EUKA|nr:hypothetical protein BLNAU_8169 [Blattamonas nauphoetae]
MTQNRRTKPVIFNRSTISRAIEVDDDVPPTGTRSHQKRHVYVPTFKIDQGPTIHRQRQRDREQLERDFKALSSLDLFPSRSQSPPVISRSFDFTGVQQSERPPSDIDAVLDTLTLQELEVLDSMDLAEQISQVNPNEFLNDNILASLLRKSNAIAETPVLDSPPAPAFSEDEPTFVKHPEKMTLTFRTSAPSFSRLRSTQKSEDLGSSLFMHANKLSSDAYGPPTTSKQPFLDVCELKNVPEELQRSADLIAMKSKPISSQHMSKTTSSSQMTEEKLDRLLSTAQSHIDTSKGGKLSTTRKPLERSRSSPNDRSLDLVRRRDRRDILKGYFTLPFGVSFDGDDESGAPSRKGTMNASVFGGGLGAFAEKVMHEQERIVASPKDNGRSSKSQLTQAILTVSELDQQPQPKSLARKNSQQQQPTHRSQNSSLPLLEQAKTLPSSNSISRNSPTISRKHTPTMSRKQTPKNSRTSTPRSRSRTSSQPPPEPQQKKVVIDPMKWRAIKQKMMMLAAVIRLMTIQTNNQASRKKNKDVVEENVINTMKKTVNTHRLDRNLANVIEEETATVKKELARKEADMQKSQARSALRSSSAFAFSTQSGQARKPKTKKTNSETFLKSDLTQTEEKGIRLREIRRRYGDTALLVEKQKYEKEVKRKAEMDAKKHHEYIDKWKPQRDTAVFDLLSKKGVNLEHDEQLLSSAFDVQGTNLVEKLTIENEEDLVTIAFPPGENANRRQTQSQPPRSQSAQSAQFEEEDEETTRSESYLSQSESMYSETQPRVLVERRGKIKPQPVLGNSLLRFPLRQSIKAIEEEDTDAVIEPDSIQQGTMNRSGITQESQDKARERLKQAHRKQAVFKEIKFALSIQPLLCFLHAQNKPFPSYLIRSVPEHPFLRRVWRTYDCTPPYPPPAEIT